MTDFEWAVRLNRLMLKFVGLWPSDNWASHQNVGPKLRRLCCFIALLLILTIPSLTSLIRIWGDIILMMDNMQYSVPLVMTTSKLCIIWYNQEALVSLIDMIERDWSKVKMANERDVMLSYAKITRVFAMCGFFMLVLGIMILFGIPCLDAMMRYVINQTESERSLPIATYYLYDVSKSPQYELTLLAQIFAIFVAGFSYSGVDNLLGLLIVHICGQLENLHSRLIHIDKYPDFDVILKYNVEDHVRLIRSIKTVDNTFHLMLLGLVLNFGIHFCLEGFLIISVLNNKSELSVMQLSCSVVETAFILLHMCLYCVVGEILVIQSEKIYHAAYEYTWYDVKPKVAKNFIIIMIRANKPLYITAGKMLPMTMATFCSLVKTSASYISVLLANQD